MTGKLFFAVFIAAFLVPENGAYAPEFIPIFNTSLTIIETFLDEVLKLGQDINKSFADALNAAEVKLRVEGIPDGKTLENARIKQKDAVISAHNMVDYLNISVWDDFVDLEGGSRNYEKELESQVQKELIKEKWDVEKVEECSLKYGKDLNSTIVWRVKSQIGCIMDIVGEGQMIWEEIAAVSEEITYKLNDITSSSDRNNIEKSVSDIKQLYGKFPVAEANAFIGNKKAQLEKLGECYDLKLGESITTVTSFLQEIVDCTKGHKPFYN